MHTISLDHDEDFDSWRAAARGLALEGVPPGDISWQVGDAPADLFAQGSPVGIDTTRPFAVPRPFIDLARSAICHSAPDRFSLLYTLLLRLRANAHALEDRADPLVQRIDRMAKHVRRDIHKMHAFVRFREVPDPDGPRFVAWFEPDHHIVRSTAGFFVRRFATMRWSILTPELSIHWDGERLSQSPGATRSDAPSDDPVEDMWKTYYASTFNPARVKIKAMTKEMPKKYWKNLPETALVGHLIAGSQAREAEMVERSQTQIAAKARDAGDDKDHRAAAPPPQQPRKRQSR